MISHNHRQPNQQQSRAWQWQHTNNTALEQRTTLKMRVNAEHIGVSWVEWRRAKVTISGQGSDVGCLTQPEADALATPDESVPNGCGTHAADPVNVIKGNFWQTWEDVSIPGRGGGLGVGRTYSSSSAAVDGPMGYGWSYTYGLRIAETSTTAKIRQEGGSVVTFYKQGSSWVAPRWVNASLSKSGSVWTFVRGGSDIFRFDAANGNRLTSIEDLSGNVTTLGYSGASTQVASVTEPVTANDPVGRKLLFTWVGGRITKITAPATQLATGGTSQAIEVTYTYTGGQLTSVTLPGGGIWTYGYDAANRMTKVREPRHYNANVNVGPFVENGYDAQGRVVWQDDRLDHRTTFNWSTAGQTTVTDPEGHVTVYKNDGITCTGIVRDPGPGQSEWVFEINPYTLGRTKVTDPNGVVTKAAFNDRGLPTVVTTPKGTTEISYTAQWQPAAVKDTSGVTTTFSYEAGSDRVSSISRPVPGGTTWSTSLIYADPDRPDAPSQVTDERGKQWLFAYNTHGDLERVTDPTAPEARKTTWAYNELGWPLTSVTPRGNVTGGTPSANTTSWEYNAAGALMKETDQLGKATEYGPDPSGYVAWVKDPVPTGDPTEQTNLTWDAAGRLITVARPDSSTLRTEYWDNGALKTQIDSAGAETGYGYDDQGRLTTITDPADRVTTFGYDLGGRVTTRALPGGSCAAPKTNCVTYGHTTANELSLVDYSDPDTSDVSFTYDTLGRRKTMTDSGIESTWTWDSIGRLEAFQEGGTDGLVDYHYYGASPLLSSIDYPGGKTVTYNEYDEAGRLKQLTPWTGSAVSFGYDANSNHTTTNTGASSGTEDTWTFDAASRMSFSNAYTLRKDTTSLATIGYTRDPEGMVRTTSGSGLPDPTETYDYGPFDMLKSDDTGTYSYDAADNLIGFPDGRRQAFDAANQLCFQATTTADCDAPPTGATLFDYDTQGNRSLERRPSVGTRRLGYDQANRLTTVTESGNSGEFTPIAANKLLDTRATSPAGVCTTTCNTFTANEIKDVQATGQGGVPATGVGAVVLNVTTINGATAGWVRVNRVGVLGAAGMVRIDPNETNNVSVIAGVDAQGRIQVQADQAVDVRITVSGWYATSSGTSGSTYTAVLPARIADTRGPTPVGTCTPSPCARLTANSTVKFKVTGVGEVPASGVSAVYVNFLAVAPHTTGTVHVNKAGALSDASINIDNSSGFPGQGAAQAGTAIATVASDGTISITSTMATDIVLDVSGWFGDNGEAEFVSVAPARMVDTRPGTAVGACVPSPCAPIAGNGTLGGTIMKFQATGRGGVPTTGVTAVVLAFTSSSSDTGIVRVNHNPATNSSAAMFHTDGTVTNDSGIVIAEPDENGQVKLSAFGAAGTSFNVFAGVVGYFRTEQTDTTTYTYTGDGLRRTKTTPDGTVTTFTWDRSRGLPLLIAEHIDEPGGTTNDRTIRYVYDPNGLVLADITTPDAGGAEPIRWYHHDQLGSTRALTNSSGDVIGTFTYSPYGELVASTGPATTPMGWAGEYRDEETGYTYLRARHYDSSTGQFLTRDALEALTRSAYGYVGNNPLNFIDPMGLAPCACGEQDSGGGLFDFISEHKVGIIKGVSWVLAGGAIIAAPITAGGSLATLPVWLAAGSGVSAVTAEALDPKPDRAQRVTLAAGTTILGGGVGGAFGAGGLTVGALINDGGLLAFDIWSSNSGESPRNELCLGGAGSW